MTETGSELVPSLQIVRAACASIITRIVEYYQSGPHQYATVEEIAAGIGLSNAAERETVYSAIDPYAEFAQKRDPEKPLLFRRVAPGEYQFLGFNKDPLDLSNQVRIKDQTIEEAYRIFLKAIEKNGQGAALRTLPLSERIASFHRNMVRSPRIFLLAQDLAERRQELHRIECGSPDQVFDRKS